MLEVRNMTRKTWTMGANVAAIIAVATKRHDNTGKPYVSGLLSKFS